jgi:hypothetical protein
VAARENAVRPTSNPADLNEESDMKFNVHRGTKGTHRPAVNRALVTPPKTEAQDEEPTKKAAVIDLRAEEPERVSESD